MPRPSMRKAIDQFCKACIFDSDWPGGGNWRKQVTDCPSTGCALYPLRPVSKPETRAERARARAERKTRKAASVHALKAPESGSQEGAVT